MGDNENGPGIFGQMMLEPVHALGVEMVGGFIEQQEIGLAQQKLRERHAALFTT
jgi:hypothetical protein